MQRLKPPTFSKQALRQPVVPGFVGRSTMLTEVAGRGDNSSAEVMLPEPIGGARACERIVLRDEP